MSESQAGRLLRWFRVARRALPWRTPFPRDAYQVLVSEIMLQQTQVGRAAAAYTRFMVRFPSIEALAAATQEQVVHAFSGLGYYRRARLLHAAARAVVERGGFPRTRAELVKLPGLGRYTGSAVAAFAFAGTDPPVDGNVARVTARVRALDLAMGSRELFEAAEDFGSSLHREERTPEVWEALMELGASLCKPIAPVCGACPLAGGCVALERGRQRFYPRPRPRRRPERHDWVVVWLERGDGRVLLRRVDEGQVLVGVWLPPFTALDEKSGAAAAALGIAREAGFDGPLTAAPAVRHTITHREITVHPFTARLPGGGVREGRPGWSWQRPADPGVPTSSILAKLAGACRSTLPPTPENLED